MISVLLRSIGKFASALYLTGLAVFMTAALAHGSVRIVPDNLFPIEAGLVGGLVVFQLALFAGEIKGMLRK